MMFNQMRMRIGLIIAIIFVLLNLGESADQSQGTSKVIFDNWNTDGVDNTPTCSPSFTISQPYYITFINTYHYNYGLGITSVGAISLERDDGTLYGPWMVKAETNPGVNNAPNSIWTAHPNVVIPAGTYIIVDSDITSWSQNSESNNCGISRVEGYVNKSECGEARSNLAAQEMEDALRSGNINATIDHIEPAQKEMYKSIFGDPDADLGRVADLLATRKLAAKTDSIEEYEVTESGMKYYVSFINITGQWYLSSL